MVHTARDLSVWVLGASSCAVHKIYHIHLAHNINLVYYYDPRYKYRISNKLGYCTRGKNQMFDPCNLVDSF